MSQSVEPTESIIHDGSQARLCKVITAAYFKASGLLHSVGNDEENHENLNQNLQRAKYEHGISTSKVGLGLYNARPVVCTFQIDGF